MGTADVTRFPVDDVRRHVDTVARVADTVTRARTAARVVTMDAGAYGALCQLLPALLNPVFEAGAGALRGAEDSMRETAAALGSVVTRTVSTDNGSADRLAAVAVRPTRKLPL